MTISEFDFTGFPEDIQEQAKTNPRLRFNLRVIQYNRQMQTLVQGFINKGKPRTTIRRFFNKILGRWDTGSKPVRYNVPKRYRIGVRKATIRRAALPKRAKAPTDTQKAASAVQSVGEAHKGAKGHVQKFTRAAKSFLRAVREKITTKTKTGKARGN